MDLDSASDWPFWKFGLKKDDLFTKLHDQYNTFSFSIQDPEAFHHDVFECSHEARTTDQFHHLLAGRKEQRLHELNSTLESASLEIIANPSLIGTEQWQYALQLFRTRSFDSLVRYFYSYLPESGSGSYPGSIDNVKSKIQSKSEHSRSLVTAVHNISFLGDSEGQAFLTHEPSPIPGTIESHLPPSPRSMTTCSDACDDAPAHGAHHSYILNNLTPARTLSLSGSESEHFSLPSTLSDSRHLHDDDEETSQPCDAGTPISDYSESFSETASFDMLEKDDGVVANIVQEKLREPSAPRGSMDVTSDSAETPTPKPEAHAGTFFDARPSPAHRRGCSFSPSRPHPLAHQVDDRLPDNDDIEASIMTRLRRRGHSPGRGRRSSPRDTASRVQKSALERARSRHRGRRRVVEC